MSDTIAWQKVDGTGDVAIAGASDYIGGFAPNLTQLVQVAEGVWSANAQPMNRLNFRTRLSFLITLAPAATAAAARAAIATQSAALATAAVDHVLLKGVFGAVTWQLANASIESVDFESIGITVRARYVFVGGAFTAA